MQTRVIVIAIVVTGLALGVGGYIKAQISEDLPVFTPGQVLTAQELNNMVETMDNLRNHVNRVTGRLVCNTEASCDSDEDLSDECQEFVDSCLGVPDPQGCIGGALFICEEDELPDGVDEDNVCDESFCAANESQRNKCLLFLADCDVSFTEECVAGALWICTNPFHNKPGL